MATPFTQALRAPNLALWEQLLDNRFVAAMADGTLPLESFRYYIEQNLIYLPNYARALGYGLAQSQNAADFERFAGSIKQIIDVELDTNRVLRDRVIAQGAADRGGAIEASPACLAYTSYLLATAASGTSLDIAAVTLPCAWSYREIAIRYPNPKPHPIYSDWLAFFASDEYRTYLDALLAKIDDSVGELAPDDLARFERHFRAGIRFEQGFWEMGFQMQRWPDRSAEPSVGH